MGTGIDNILLKKLLHYHMTSTSFEICICADHGNMASKDLTDSPATATEMKPSEDAAVHGVITNVSPTRKGTSPYFDAKICHGDMLLASFHCGERD